MSNRIVPMKVDHLDRVMEIEQLSFIDPWSKNSFINEIRENPYAVYFVFLEEGHVVAYIGGWLITDELHITNLAVDKDFRKKGIGEALINKMLQFSSGQGIARATLEVRVSNNTAINFYKKMGFVSVGRRPGYYTNNHEDALIMWKEIIGDIYDRG